MFARKPKRSNEQNSLKIAKGLRCTGIARENVTFIQFMRCLK